MASTRTRTFAVPEAWQFIGRTLWRNRTEGPDVLSEDELDDLEDAWAVVQSFMLQKFPELR